MALLAVQDISEGGAVTLVAAAAGGDQVPQGTRAGGWDHGVILVVRNGGASPITVTVAGLAGVAVPAAGTALIPVFGVYNGAPHNVTYSGVTTVTVGAARMVD